MDNQEQGLNEDETREFIDYVRERDEQEIHVHRKRRHHSIGDRYDSVLRESSDSGHENNEQREIEPSNTRCDLPSLAAPKSHSHDPVHQSKKHKGQSRSKQQRHVSASSNEETRALPESKHNDTGHQIQQSTENTHPMVSQPAVTAFISNEQLMTAVGYSSANNAREDNVNGAQDAFPEYKQCAFPDDDSDPSDGDEDDGASVSSTSTGYSQPDHNDGHIDHDNGHNERKSENTHMRRHNNEDRNWCFLCDCDQAPHQYSAHKEFAQLKDFVVEKFGKMKRAVFCTKIQQMYNKTLRRYVTGRKRWSRAMIWKHVNEHEDNDYIATKCQMRKINSCIKVLGKRGMCTRNTQDYDDLSLNKDNIMLYMKLVVMHQSLIKSVEKLRPVNS